MPREWTPEALLEAARSFQPACVIVAAAELDVVAAFNDGPMDARSLAEAIDGDERATTVLADALTALEILTKIGDRYRPSPGIAPLLKAGDAASVIPMLRHQANCLRSWAQLATVVRTGRCFEREPSVRGPDEDRRSFIEAMHVTSREAAPRVVRGLESKLGPLEFEHLLDVGGGPGTWAMAFLEANPSGRATIFDLPEVIPIARDQVARDGFEGRIDFAPGDLETDELPPSVDVVWISAVAHMNSREQNRALYAKALRALRPGGHILIRDIVMDDLHTSPPAGALFAINMLVNTEGGGTYSLAETREDLQSAGFGEPEVIPGERDMDWVIRAPRA
jgi:SAM-dependent methyltransferase